MMLIILTYSVAGDRDEWYDWAFSVISPTGGAVYGPECSFVGTEPFLAEIETISASVKYPGKLRSLQVWLCTRSSGFSSQFVFPS